jgi:hypothetical protein
MLGHCVLEIDVCLSNKQIMTATRQ